MDFITHSRETTQSSGVFVRVRSFSKHTSVILYTRGQDIRSKSKVDSEEQSTTQGNALSFETCSVGFFVIELFDKDGDSSFFNGFPWDSGHSTRKKTAMVLFLGTHVKFRRGEPEVLSISQLVVEHFLRTPEMGTKDIDVFMGTPFYSKTLSPFNSLKFT